MKAAAQKSPTRSSFQIFGYRALAARACIATLTAMILLPAGFANADIASWQRSISIYPDSPSDFGSSGFEQVVTHAKSLGFNYVTLVIPYYQSNIYSTDVAPGGNTPTDSSLISAIQYAHAQGMGVILKLHLDPEDGAWRATINPSDRTTWFSNYKTALMKYAQMAELYGVEEYCIGTELIDMSSATVNPGNTSAWESMISAVRSVYHGKLFYDANWGGSSAVDEPPQIGFWSDLDYIGISAYYNLDGDDSVANLENDWSTINSSTIEPLESQWGKPILFSEVGYRSVTNAHLEPWNSSMGGSYDPQEQVNDYTALLQYWNNYSYMQGLGIWYDNSNPSSGGSGDTDYLIANKPAEQTIQQYFLSPPASNGGGSNGGTTSNAAFAVAGGANPSSASTGGSVNLTASITDQGSAISNANVDIEVYNSSGAQVLQHTFGSQNFSSGQNLQYAVSWTPSSSGTYTIKIGVFSSDWSTLYTWNNSAATIAVSASTGSSGGSTSSQGGQIIHVWWPTNGVSVSGVQPFKAVVNTLPTSQYTMYWQVDSGALNQMQPSSTDSPHMESDVDLSQWTWRGSGPYTVNFVAKDGIGNMIAQQAVQINISH